MRRVLIIGCGDIAMRIIPLLRGRFHLYALVRNPAYGERLRALGVRPIIGDLDSRSSLHRIATIADTMLYFAPPANPKGSPGISHDIRTANLLAALSQGRLPQRLLYISTSGVYGDYGGKQIDETAPLHPQSDRGKLRADAERQIRTWACRSGVQAVILRVPGIYASDRLPVERLRAGVPTILAGEDSYTNHIHADDLARIVVAALHHARSNRIYHATGDDDLKMGEYFDLVADVCGLSRPRRLPREQVRLAVSPLMWSFMCESRRLSNARLKSELKVRLQYPSVRSFLATLSA